MLGDWKGSKPFESPRGLATNWAFLRYLKHSGPILNLNASVKFLLDRVAPLIRDTPPTCSTSKPIIGLATFTLLDRGDLGVVTQGMRVNILFKIQAIYGF
tara:strand:- start:154 stop:453 length:300 start_codon:yes stop_codon:yes gene_type:complete